MTKTSPYRAARHRWMDLYGPLQDGFYIPDQTKDAAKSWPSDPDGPLPTPIEFGPGKYRLCSLVVDMTDVLAAMEDHQDWSELEIIADVIVFPMVVQDERFDGFSFGLGFAEGQNLRLTARSIDVVDGQAMFVSYSRDVSIEICAEHITGPIKIGFADQDFATFHDVAGPDDGAGSVQFSGTSPSLRELSGIIGDGVKEGSDLYWILQSCFNVGSILAHDRRGYKGVGGDLSPPGTPSDRQNLAADILSWVQTLAATGSTQATQQLSLSAANMAGIVRGQSAAVPYVPKLKVELYQSLVDQLADVTIAYESSFDRASKTLDQMNPVADYIAATGANFQDIGTVSDQLIAQVQTSVQENQQLLEQNRQKLTELTELDGGLDHARLKFQSGVDDYKREKKAEATLAIAEAAIEVGVSIGAMAAGDEEAATGAVEGAKAVEKAAKETTKIAKLIETIKKIAKMVAKLKVVLDALKKTNDAIQDFQKIGPDADMLGKGISRPDANTGDVMDAAYWQVLRETAEEILTPLSDIDGASDYLTAMRHLSIYGAAVTANYQTLIASQQKLLKLTLDAKTQKDMSSRLDDISERQDQRRAALQSAKVLLYQNLLRMKGQVLVYMDAHSAAYKYWAVEADLPDHCVPFLTDSAADLKDKLVDLSKLRLQAMEAFNPEPEPMHARLFLRDPALLATLARDRRVSFTLSPDDPAFQLEEDPGPDHPASCYERVRVEGERIYLNAEAVPDPEQTVKIAVRTNGHYTDSYHRRGPFTYVGDSAGHTFEYRPKDDRDDPIGDARAADGFGYFHPTPFTTWTLTIETDPGALALDQLTEVEFHLFGNWSPSLSAV